MLSTRKRTRPASLLGTYPGVPAGMQLGVCKLQTEHVQTALRREARCRLKVMGAVHMVQGILAKQSRAAGGLLCWPCLAGLCEAGRA